MSSINDLVVFYMVDSSNSYNSKQAMEMVQACLIMSYFGVVPSKAAKGPGKAHGQVAFSLTDSKAAKGPGKAHGQVAFSL